LQDYSGSNPREGFETDRLKENTCSVADMYRNHALFARAFFLIEYAVRWNRLKSRGMHPELPYDMALSDTLTGRNDADRRRT